MRTQHLGNFFHRFETRAHGSSALVVQEFASPGRAFATPEMLEIFPEQIGPDGFEINGQQFLEFDDLFVGQVFRSFEQTPAAAGKQPFFAPIFQLLCLCGADGEVAKYHSPDRATHSRSRLAGSVFEGEFECRAPFSFPV